MTTSGDPVAPGASATERGLGSEPKILAILCHHCAWSAADAAGAAKLALPAGLRAMRVMCAGRVEPALVVEALGHGADGVLIGGCHPGDCHNGGGNLQAAARLRLLRRALADLGEAPERVRLAWTSARESARFAAIAAEMAAELKGLGRS